VRVPLDQVRGGGDGDDDTGPAVRAEAPPHVLGDGLGGALREVEEKLSALPEDPPQEARHGENDVAMGNGRENLLLEPLCPQELALLLARRAKRPSATGERAKHARPAHRAPKPREAVFDEATAHEPAQHPLDHRPQRAMLPSEADGPDSQQLLEVLLDQTEERGLARPSRLVDPATDLHTSRPTGGRASGENGRGGCPSRPAVSGREGACTPGRSGQVRRAAGHAILEIFDRMHPWRETIGIVTPVGARWKRRPSCWRAGAYCTRTRTGLEAVRPSMRRAWKTCSPAASLHRTV